MRDVTAFCAEDCNLYVLLMRMSDILQTLSSVTIVKVAVVILGWGGVIYG